MDTKEEARKLLDRTMGLLRPVRDGVVRTYEVSSLKLEIAGLKRSLDDASRDLGRRAIETLRQQGTLSVDEVSPLLRRVDDLEDRVAQKERRIADIERAERDPDRPKSDGKA